MHERPGALAKRCRRSCRDDGVTPPCGHAPHIPTCCRHSNELRRWSAGPPDVYLEKQLEQLEWQRRTLREVLSASGNAERAELLKQHADEEASTLLLSLLDKVSERRRRRRWRRC